MPRYILNSLTFPWQASKRNESLSLSELKRGYRVLGGNRGDLHFTGYGVDTEGTELAGVELVTAFEDLPLDEAREIAVEIVEEAYASIGAECVEHS